MNGATFELLSLRIHGSSQGRTFNSSESGKINLSLGFTNDVNYAHTFNVGMVLGGSTVNFTGNQAQNVKFTSTFELDGNKALFGGSSADASFELTGVVSGSGGQIELDSGYLILSNTGNSYTGATTIDGGTLQVRTDSALGTTAGATTLNGGSLDFQNVTYSTTEGLTINGGTLKTTTGTSSFAGAITLGANGAVDVSGTQLTLSGIISQSGGTRTLSKSGSGILVLSGDNTYGGDTTNSAGTLSIGAGGSTGSVAGNIVNNATLLYNRTGELTQSTAISGSGAVNKIGAGTVTLSGNNSYTGATTVSNGVIVAAHNSALGATNGGTEVKSGAALHLSGGITIGSDEALTIAGTGISSGGALRSVSGSNAYTGLITASSALTSFGAATNATLVISNVNSGGQEFWVVGDGTTIVAGGATNSGGGTAFVKTNTGTAILSASNAWSGAEYIREGTVVFSNNNALGTGGTTYLGAATNASSATATLTLGSSITNSNAIVVEGGGTGVRTLGYQTASGTGASNNTVSGAISGAGAVVKDGSGVLVLSASNDYSGGTTLEDGTLRVGNNAAVGSGTLAINGGTLAASSGTARTLTNSITLGGDVQFGDATGTGNLSLLGAVDLGSSTRTLTVSNSRTTLEGVISGTGGVTKQGAGTLRLTASNTYSGTTTLSDGELYIDHSSALGTGGFVQTGAGSLLTVDASGTITNTMSIYNVSFVETVTLTGAKTLNDTTTITVDTGDTVTEQGVVGGSGGLTKEGAGELILNGSANNTYTGATVVNGGSLVLENSSGNAINNSSSITVNTGGTLVLGASNQIGDSIGLVLNGGTFLVGAETVTENLGTLTLSASSTIDLGAYGTSGTRTLMFDDSSAMTWIGTLTITNWQGVAQTQSDVTKLLFGTGGLTSAQLSQIVFANQGINGGMLVGDDGELVPVPEPRVYAAAVALLAAIGWRERKRVKALLVGLRKK